MYRKFLLSVLPFLLLAMFNAPIALAADSESLAREAEQAGKYREALTHYVSALQSISEGSSKDQQLREKIITLVQKLTPPPAVPEEAEKYLVRGQGAVEIAKTSDDYLVAIAEFKKAARLAPWWADIYYNLGLVQDKAGLYTDGIRSLKLCLKAAPNAPDAKKVELMIVKLEFKQEQAKKEAAKKRQEEQESVQIERLAGVWKHRGLDLNWSVTVQGSNIEIIPIMGKYGDSRKFRGTIEGLTIKGTVYINLETWHAGIVTRPFTGTISPDGKTIHIVHMQVVPMGANGDRAHGWGEQEWDLIITKQSL